MKQIWGIGLGMILAATSCIRAGDETITPPATGSVMSATTAAGANTRYGLFDGLDRRSVYGQGAFPEPFLVDDSDGEVNEARLDWLHTNGEGNSHSDNIKAEVEKGFGPLTLEIEAPLERDSEAGQISTNFANVDLGARCPFYQYVDSKAGIDNSVGVGIEVGVPVGAVGARNTEVVPKIFDDLALGEHFTLQTLIGYSTLIGNSPDDGRQQNLEYGFVFGYSLPHEQLPIPGVLQLIPVFELNGAWQMNQGDHGHDNLLALAGFRVNTKPIGPIQPRLGIGYVFPVDYGAHEDVHWGIQTSLVFEY